MNAAVVLAAGASSRMGRPKALLRIGPRTALESVVEALRGGGVEDVVVVVGRHAAEIRAAPLEGARLVEHPGWAAGRTSSLQAGLAALRPGAGPVVVALVDMPLVRASTVAALLRALRPGDEAAVPVHAGRRGHPVALAAALLPRIAALAPDEPLRDLLRAARRLEVAVDDPGVLLDLDTPEDLLRLR